MWEQLETINDRCVWMQLRHIADQGRIRRPQHSTIYKGDPEKGIPAPPGLTDKMVRTSIKHLQHTFYDDDRPPSSLSNG